MEPLIIRALRGEEVERAPVWFMRQAGRYMKVYRELRSKVSFLVNNSKILKYNLKLINIINKIKRKYSH